MEGTVLLPSLPQPLLLCFPVHCSLRYPHYLNAWNRLTHNLTTPHFSWTHLLAAQSIQWCFKGLKILDFPISCPLGKQLSQFCLPGATFCSSQLIILLEDDLPGSLTSRKIHLSWTTGLDFFPSVCFTYIFVALHKTVHVLVLITADPQMVAAVSSLPPPVSPVRTTGGKALFENLYLPALPPGLKPLNSFASLHSSSPEITAPSDSRPANSRFVKDVRNARTCFDIGCDHIPGGGGGTWVFFGWVCAARDSKLAPHSGKNFP